MDQINVIRISANGPGDVSGLASLIDSGAVDPAQIIAIMGKTEGNGCVNDFTREYASFALAALLGRHLGLTPQQVEARVAFVMSGGTEGVLSPHNTVFIRARSAANLNAGSAGAGEKGLPGAGEQRLPEAGEKRLAVGVAFTRNFKPEEIGRQPQIDATAQAVREAMRDAAIDSAADVHFVQIKCPLLTSGRIADARARAQEPVTSDTYESMAYSRGASALGVAVATGEVLAEAAVDGAVLHDWSLNSSVASTSAGVELEHNVVMVMGMSPHSSSPFVIAHDVMSDALDAQAVRRAIERLMPIGAAQERVVNAFAKAEASPNGQIRGFRHTMLNDSDINSTRHARAAVGAVVASVVGHGMVYVSGGAEHQGPPGGGPVAVIARL